MSDDKEQPGFESGGTAGSATRPIEFGETGPAQPKKRKSAAVKPEHSVRTTRYYSLSNDDLANLGIAQGVATTAFSLATGFLFAYLGLAEDSDRKQLYGWATAILYVVGTAFLIYRGTRMRGIKREHDFPEDKTTMLTKAGRYWRSWND